MASIQERTSKRTGATSYRVGYRHQGRLCWTASVDTPEAAVYMKDLFESRGVELALATIAARIGRSTDDGPPTLAEVLEKHLSVVASYATPGTVQDYRRMAARTWLPHLGDMPVDRIESDHVTDWIAKQRRQETRRSQQARAKAVRLGLPEPEPEHYAPKSIVNAQGFLSDVLDYAVSRGHITGNVAAGAKTPDDAEAAEMVFLTPNEFARLLDAVPEYWRPLVTFLAASGLRWGEATALRRGDFDLDALRPFVRVSRAYKRGETKTYIGSTKSGRGVRTVPLPGSAVTAIRPLVEADGADAQVFRGERGGTKLHGHFNERVWGPAVARSGIGKRPRIHDLRHTHASWLIADGVPLPVIQRRLGHESITTTVDRYGHLAPDAHWGAAEAAEAALSGALPEFEQAQEMKSIES